MSLPTPPGAPFSGSYSLAFTASHLGAQSAGLTVPLCAGTGTSTGVTGISFYLYVDGPAYPVSKYDIAFAEDTGYLAGINFLNTSDQFASKQWIQLSSTFPSVDATHLEFFFSPTADWSGTIYIDQVQLTH